MGRKKGVKNKPKEFKPYVAAPIGQVTDTSEQHLVYEAAIRVLGVWYKVKGATKNDAIAALKVPLGKGVSILKVTKDDKSQEKVFNNVQTARLFSASPTVREINLKQVCTRFDL